MQLHWDVPGYRPLDSEAYLDSISTGGNLVTLRFEQEASAFGVVRVHVRGAAVPVDANLLRSREVFEGHTVSCARLLLESQGGEAHEYSLFPDGAGTWTNTHVPHGTYKARIGAWNSHPCTAANSSMPMMFAAFAVISNSRRAPCVAIET